MAYLPHAPRTFRELVLADLLRAQRLIKRIDDVVDPQSRIASPEGDWWIAMTLSSDLAVRRREFQLVSRFMAWKLSPGFTLASEIAVPDAVYCIGVTHRERHDALSRIERNPIRFGDVEWMSESAIGDEIPELLPTGRQTLSSAELTELEQWFGRDGRFPALKIGNA